MLPTQIQDLRIALCPRCGAADDVSVAKCHRCGYDLRLRPLHRTEASNDSTPGDAFAIEVRGAGAAPADVATHGTADSRHSPPGSANATLLEALRVSLPRRIWAVIGLVFLFGLALSFYLGYQQRNTTDLLSRPATMENAPNPVGARSAEGARVAPAVPAITQAPVALVPARDQAPGSRLNPAKPDRQIALTAPGVPPKVSRSAESRATATPRARADPPGNEVQPARFGPCTAAVAALGLCTPETTKGGN